jgi:hypothetical protein
MRFIERLRSTRRPTAETTPAGDPAAPDALPITGYDDLHEKDVIARFPELSQVELAELESYERSHGSRRVVLDKLRYMRGPEPILNYDALEAQEVVRQLESADTATIRAIRDYEGKFRRRRQVLGAATEALPNAVANAGERDHREEKAERTRTGIQDRRHLTG